MTDKSAPADAPPDETPVHDAQTGEFRGNVTGLQNFRDSWKQNVDVPHQMVFSGWQMVDENHPVETGAPGYRLVHKTIRKVPFPMVELSFGTLLLRFTNGEVTVGEPLIESGLQARRAGEFLIPEWGEIRADENSTHGYHFQPGQQINFRANQQTFPPGNFVEILCQLGEDVGSTYAEQVAAGRALVAPLTTMLDMFYGERLLGPVLTEEVGELFADWHWNRKLGGRSVGLESQARIDLVDGNQFINNIGPAVDRFLDDLDEEVHQRVRIASQWYWQAEGEPDEVLRFVGYWLVVEALELGENSNISPVKEKVANLLGVTKAEITDQVGLLYSKRNKLLHGKLRVTTVGDVTRVRALATTLLESHLLGKVSPERQAALRDAMGLGGD